MWETVFVCGPLFHRKSFHAESGIHDGAAVKLLAEHGVSGVLIGELLMRSPSIEAKMKELLEAAS